MIVKLDGILARFAMVISRPLLQVPGNFPSYDLQGAAPVVRLTWCPPCPYPRWVISTNYSYDWGGGGQHFSIVPTPLYTCTQPFDPCRQPVILAQCVGPTSSKMKTPFVSLSKQSSNDDDIKLPCMSRINVSQLVWFIYMGFIMISYQPSSLSMCWWWGRHSNGGIPSDVGTRRCWRCDKKRKRNWA